MPHERNFEELLKYVPEKNLSYGDNKRPEDRNAYEHLVQFYRGAEKFLKENPGILDYTAGKQLRETSRTLYNLISAINEKTGAQPLPGTTRESMDKAIKDYNEGKIDEQVNFISVMAKQCDNLNKDNLNELKNTMKWASGGLNLESVDEYSVPGVMEVFNTTDDVAEKIYKEKSAKKGLMAPEEQVGAVEPLEAPGLHVGTKKNYDDYLYIHKYPAAGKEAESLAKILAASTLKHEHEEFSVSSIRKGANALLKQPTFKQLAKNPARARLLLSGKESDVVMGMTNPFKASKEKQRAVLTKLKNMANQMDAPDGRTQKWAKLVNSLKNIDLGRDHTYEEQLTNIFKNNEDYMKGKKSIRRDQDGRNRFDQSLDVLAELAEVSDFAKDKAETLVDRINEVRKTEPDGRNGVSLANYGADKQGAHVNEGHQLSVVEAAKHQQDAPRVGL
ncbi:MAG: hypothetical protein J6P72_00385 [Firmicutes bacterium]|nr:hypothetical protein [Bacillota bacterium]